MNNSRLPKSLLDTHDEVVRRAIENEKLYGNVVDRMIALLEEMITDPELWQQVLDERELDPYGRGLEYDDII